MYTADLESPACSHFRNRSTASEVATNTSYTGGETNMFRDIDHNVPSAHVPGCLVSDRIRLQVRPEDDEDPLVVNVTFPESIYEQSYFFRVYAVLSDSSVILQDRTYDNWGASSRSCQYAEEYLQT